MPTLKLYVDAALSHDQIDAVAAAMEPMRALICADLNVTPPECHLVMLQGRALPGQVQINAEMHVMPRPERTRDLLVSVGTRLKEMMANASGASVAVRISQHNAETFIGIK